MDTWFVFLLFFVSFLGIILIAGAIGWAVDTFINFWTSGE